MTDPAAVRAMLEARSVAVVGASARPGSFGERLVTEIARSPSRPRIHLVNPRYDDIQGRACLPSLDHIGAPVDLVLFGVGEAGVEDQLALAAARGDRSGVVFGSAWSSGDRLALLARDAGMALCGPGCMGFLNLAGGVRALGYLERADLRNGGVALVSHSGSGFSALLRSRRRIAYSLAVSSGRELVTTTADYLDYALELPETSAVALLLETIREPARLRAALRRAAAQGVPVVLLAVGGTPPGADLVTAHSGALAGSHAAWEALTEAHGLLRVDDLDEMADLLELLGTGRRASPAQPGSGIATVHDSGAERALVADLAHEVGVPFARLSSVTEDRLAGLLDPGLRPGNPLDVWGTGEKTRELFAGCLIALADDPAVSALALSVDLVEEYDADESYPHAVLEAASATPKPVVVLSNFASALDLDWASRLREAGVPVLEGTRSGLRALGELLRLAETHAAASPAEVDEQRRARWADRLSTGPLSMVECFALLRDYGIPTVEVEAVRRRDDAVSAARRLGWPVVLKTDEAVAHKWDVGGVHLGLNDDEAVASAYDDLAMRLGPGVLVSTAARSGTELALGVIVDHLVGPLVMVAAGGLLVEVLHDRAVALPPLDEQRARRMVDGLACRPLLDGVRGAADADLSSLCDAICGIGQLAVELGEYLTALDVNPLIVNSTGVVAVDVLLIPTVREPPAPEREGRSDLR